MANKPDEANFFPDVPQFPSMGTFQPVYGKFDLTTYIQGASDYEIMAFLVGKYNACLEAYGTVTKLSSDTVTACKQLQDWINSWFDNLDVQEELNKKIDSMVADGSFSAILSTIVADYGAPEIVNDVRNMTNAKKLYVLNTNSHIYNWTGNEFADSGIIYGSTVSAIISGTGNNVGSIVPGYEDLNTFPRNTFTYYSSDTTPRLSNAPTDVKGHNITVLDYSVNNDTGHTQLLYDMNDKQAYIRGNWADGWKDWVKLGGNDYISRGTGYNVGRIVPGYEDLNTFPRNTFTYYARDTTPLLSNAPTDVKGHNITVMDYSVNYDTGHTQLLYDMSDKQAYIRGNWSDGWKDWVKLGGNDYISSGTGNNVGSIVPGYEDLNTFPRNTFTYYASDTTPRLSNAPTDVKGHNITVLDYSVNNDTGHTQLLYDMNDKQAYIRGNWSDGWKDWAKLGGNNYISSGEKNYFHSVRKPYTKAENTIFCGDSITYGVTIPGERTPKPWPTLFAEKMGITVYSNMAQSGSTIGENINDLPSILDQIKRISDKQNTGALFIAGGVNDWSRKQSIEQFKISVKNMCDYISANFVCPVYFITPIECCNIELINDTPSTLQSFRNALTEVVTQNDKNMQFSVIQGNLFNFPDINCNEEYISAMFGDRMHPSTTGYQSAYISGVLNAIM